MSTLRTTGDGQPKRLPHISVASLSTNASGIADSTLSYAGSDWSGISQFPSPPAEIPTPTLSNFGTPTSYNFTERLPPSIPDYETPSRFQFGTPPIPRSPATSVFPGSSNGHDVRSVKSAVMVRPSNSSGGVKVSSDPAPKLEIPSELCAVDQSPKPSSSLPPQPSTSSQRVRPLALRKTPLPHPPCAVHPLERRPGTPQSVAAASSLLDWSDAASGISINPSEERLLSTSFITSLLSQSPEPFPGVKISNASSRLARHPNDERDLVSPQTSRDGHSGDTSPLHQSIPPFHPSDLLTADGREALISGAKPAPDRQSVDLGSSCASKGHSSETLHLLVRKPSIAHARGGVEMHPVGVMPAYRIAHSVPKPDDMSTSLGTVDHSGNTSSSMASKLPVHHVDASQNVQRGNRFDGGGIPRECKDDSMNHVGANSSLGRPSMLGHPALPTITSSKNRLVDAISMPRSSVNQAPSSRYPLQRNQSLKSVVSSLVSRISNNSAVRRAKHLAWLRQRPLPPLPVANNPPPEFPNGREIQKSEESIPLPTLAKRAEELSGILRRGRFPTVGDKENEFYYKEAFSLTAVPQSGDRVTYVQINRRMPEGGDNWLSLFPRLCGQEGDPDSPPADSLSAVETSLPERKWKRWRLWTIAICSIIGVFLAIAIPVALSQRKHSSSPVCNGNSTGAACTLDATCVCTSSGGSCKPLAGSLFLLLSDVNELFAANFSPDRLSDAVVSAVGESTDGLCRGQALLIDVEPGLVSAAAPNRTKWAQAAILWNLGMSEDISATKTLQKFVSSASWKSLSTIDGPIGDSNKSFVQNVSGFSFDFAAQSVMPLDASFRQSSPSQEQLAEVSDTAERALDRMYSFAIASSSQRQKALNNYWTAVLQQQESELQTFIEAVQNSPFLIPFDSTSSPGGDDIADLMANASSTQFPVPIACYPGLDSTQVARVNTLETNVFGLSTVSATSHFTQSCFPDHAVYGIIDLLRLRLPFPDDRKGVALQASVLSKDSIVRAVIYSGEELSALPGASTFSNVTSPTTDPREFGTPSFLNHVLLNYFSSISNITLAMNLVSHVLSSTTPPESNSDLTKSLSSLPVLEFAIFGSIRPQDIAFSVSSFSTPTGSLFFGSGASGAFRSWALVNSSASVIWAESAVSPDAVHEDSSVDPNFESVWKPASELAASGATDANDVQRVTSSLRSLGLFSP